MTLISTWDSGQPGANWDVGLQLDVNVGPTPGDPTYYLRLVTSEHIDKPNFIATLTAVLQPLADVQVRLAGMPGIFDLDVAVGDQEDKTGQWVGISRELQEPLTGVYFSLDTVGLGFDQGTWKGPFDPSTYLTALPDDAYRLLLRAKILNNKWDGTIPGAYAAWAELF